MTGPTWTHADWHTYDLLAAVADPHPAIGADAAAIFLAACRKDAMANNGEVSVNRVRALLADADIPPRRYSALWAHNTGDGRAMRKLPGRWETCRGSASRNNGKPCQIRKWMAA